MELVINRCFGGFVKQKAAYEKMIEYGIPAVKYIEMKIDPKTGLYGLNENGDDKVIYDNDLGDKKRESWGDKYWDCWTSDIDNRNNPILIRVVKELGEKANHETHRSW